MAQKISTRKRNELAAAEKRFPGMGGNSPQERIQAVPYEGIQTSIEQIRRGTGEVANAPWLLPANVEIQRRRVEFFRQNRFDRNVEADRNAYAQRLINSIGNPQAASELAAYRQFEMTGDIMATPFALAAYQTINLAADEMPMIVKPRSRNLQRFTVRTQALDGGAREDQWRADITISSSELELLSTDKVEYSLWDLQQGNISAADQVNTELQYDMDMKVDSLALSNLQGAQTASGLRALLSIHPSIIASNIPDTNYLDLTNVGTYGVANTLTLARLKAILNHIAMFAAADPTRALTMTQILMSPQNIRDPWDFIDLVSGYDSSGTFGQNKPSETIPEPVREQIFNTGMFTQAWGYKFLWSPNPQIAKGRLYILTNQPLGWMFTKSNFDRVVRYDDTNSPVHAEHNMGQIMLQKALAFFIPDLWKHHVVIVDF